jgi:formylglycine-generating enzyme required for sulfatase activity
MRRAWLSFALGVAALTVAGAAAAGAKAPGDRFRDCAGCPEMVVVPAGAFTIGSPDDEPGRAKDEGPRKQVTLPRPIAVGRHEVTLDQYRTFLRATGRAVSGGCLTDRRKQGDWQHDPATNLDDPGFRQAGDHPVACVSFEDAQAYVAWLNGRAGGGYRLPSEAEWEYFARAGTTDAYPWGPDVSGGCAHANLPDLTLRRKYPDYQAATCDDGGMNTTPVGAYRANPFGLYDVLGNLAEWVEDCATMSYDDLPADGTPNRSGDCARRVVRGGSWGSMPKDSRVANRIRYPVAHTDDSVGIRVVKDLR